MSVPGPWGANALFELPAADLPRLAGGRVVGVNLSGREATGFIP